MDGLSASFGHLTAAETQKLAHEDPKSLKKQSANDWHTDKVPCRRKACKPTIGAHNSVHLVDSVIFIFEKIWFI